MMFLTLPNCPGGGPQSIPSRVSVVLVDEENAGGTPGREYPFEDQERRRPLAGMMKPSLPSRISVVLVDGTMAGGTPGRECPREDQDLLPRAGVTRPSGVSVGGGSAGSPCVGGTLSYLDVAGRLLPVVLAGGSSPVGPVNPAGPDGPVVAGGPIDSCGALSPLFHEVL